jgi:hypothetical protein
VGQGYIEDVTTPSGALLRVCVRSADPVSDIAVLGALDGQECFDDCMKFEEWSEATQAVPLAITTPRYRVPLRAHILSHQGNWIEAQIVRYTPPGLLACGCMRIEGDDPIKG